MSSLLGVGVASSERRPPRPVPGGAAYSGQAPAASRRRAAALDFGKRKEGRGAMRAPVIGLAAVLAASPGAAHHGFGTYDLNADMRVEGTLVGVDFVNPHSWL